MRNTKPLQIKTKESIDWLFDLIHAEGYDDNVVHNIIQGSSRLRINNRIVEFAENIPGYVSLPPKIGPFLDLTVCGDVEKNPGPTNNKSKNGNRQSKTRNRKTPSTKITNVQQPITKSKVVSRVAMPNISSKQGTVVVRFTEPIKGVTASGTAGAFNVDYGFCAPALVPWLAGIAANFAKFKYKRIRYRYIPAVATVESGRVTLGLAYDPSDPSPTNQSQLMTFSRAVTGPVWGDLSLDVDVNKFNYNQHMMANSTTISTLLGGLGSTAAGFAASTALSQRSPVICLVGVDGAASSLFCGTLMIDYEIELTDPIPAALNV